MYVSINLRKSSQICINSNNLSRMRAIIVLAVFLAAFAFVFAADEGSVPGNCDGPQIVFSADLNDCNRFYECYANRLYHMTCPPNLYFNPVLNVCDFPERARCFSQRDNIIN